MRKNKTDGPGKVVEPEYEVHYADGRRLEQPMPVSQILDAQLHQGLQDAAQYDQYAIEENHPLRQERAAVDELTRTCEAIANEYTMDILRERDVTRVKWQRYRGAVSDLDALRDRRAELDRDVEAELNEMEQPSSPRHVPQVRLRTAPEQRMHRVAWSLYIIATVGGLVELLVNYLAAQALRDDLTATVMFAVAVSFSTIMIPWWAARELAEPSSRFKPLAYASLGFLLLLLIGLGWLRYAYAAGKMSFGLQQRHQTLSGTGAFAIALVSVFLPLALSVLIMLKVVHDRHDVTYQTWANRRHLADLETQISDAEEDLSGKERTYHDAIDFGERVRAQAVTAIQAYRATMVQAVESYFDGLAQALATPAATAVLDRRFTNFQRDFHAEGDQIVDEAIAKLTPEPVWTPETDTVARLLMHDIADAPASTVPTTAPAMVGGQ